VGDERREERRGIKKRQKFNWADDMDTSITPISITHHEPATITNVNVHTNPFPATCGASGPITCNNIPLAVPTIHPKTIVKPNILVGTTTNTDINMAPMVYDLSALRSDTLNPWASLCCHHCPQKPHQPIC
jgi:hypothetical protein